MAQRLYKSTSGCPVVSEPESNDDRCTVIPCGGAQMGLFILNFFDFASLQHDLRGWSR